MNAVTTAYLSLGSNLNPQANLRLALEHLSAACRVVTVSSAYRTSPQGSSAALPSFVNMAVCVQTMHTPLTFKLNVLRPIEHEMGRVRDPSPPRMPHPIDLDIVLWGSAVLEFGSKPWRVPDPGILLYAYITVPLAEIAPEVPHPETGEPLRQIAARLDSSGFEQVAL